MKKINYLFLTFLFIMIFYGCSNSEPSNVTSKSELSQLPSVSEKSEEIQIGKIDDLGGTVIAVDKFDNGFKISDLIGITKDERYYLFQLNRFVEGSNELNDRAKLVIWDNKEKCIFDETSGRYASSHIGKPIINVEERKVYFTDIKGVYLVDFKKDESIDILKKYQIKSSKETSAEWENKISYVDQIAYDDENLFINISFKENSKENYKIYRINENGCKEIIINIQDEIRYIRNLGIIDGKKFVYRINSKFYVVDYDGNILEERPLIDNNKFNLLGSNSEVVSSDGKKLLYSSGKTPTDINIYDFETKETRILCPGGIRNDGSGDILLAEKYGESYLNFWTGNNSVFAIIGLYKDNQPDNETVVAKTFKVN